MRILKPAYLCAAITVFLSVSIYADCPATQNVKYKCMSVSGQKHCNWTAPWYEGFPEAGAEAHATAASFQRVFWGAKSNKPKAGDIGTTICFYQSPNGKEIELVQNNWGGVAYPSSEHWSEGNWQNHNGRICGNGLTQSQCAFEYPSAG